MKFLRTLAVFAVLAVMFTLGYGYRDISNNRPVKFTRSEQEVSATQLFSSQFKHIESSFYKPVDPLKIKYAAMSGMMASLGDPHTTFMEPVIAKEFNSETQANFVGIGARLDDDPLGAKIVVVFEGSPAERAGVRAGDVVTAVDGKSVAGIPVETIVTKIRGEEGTKVKLTVLRNGSASPLILTATRATIITPTVEGSMIEDTKVGRIAISTFADPTTEQFDKELAKLESKGIKGLVIDLRGNGGGLLRTAIDLLSRFVEDKIALKMKARGGREEVAKTNVGYLHKFNYPIVVLVNEDSASASEIFAGCLRDYQIATLVGVHTYGKASVQDVRGLIDGSNAKYTIAKYYLPVTPDISRKVDADGQYLEGGLIPDVKVELDLENEVKFGDIKSDNQLAKAVEVVKSKM